MKRPHVLVVDDKENIVKLLARVLSPEADVTTAADGTRALGLLAEQEFDVVVSDIRMPGADGMVVLRDTKSRHPETEVILMTAFATVPDAVGAMKEGAYDYLQKPFEPEEALFVIRRAVERRQLRAEARELQRRLAQVDRHERMIAEAPAMAPVLDLVQRAARSDSTVLISGESGSGKEVVARAIHETSSRQAKSFVAVNCAAMPENLFEAELFGYTKGSFTGASTDRAGLFEEADGGTLLLDELGELPLSMQAKLNRVLQQKTIRRLGGRDEQTIDVRVIVATNVDLRAAVDQGRFREDLYYRVNVFPIALPPLRDRRVDVPLLAVLFVNRHRREGQPDGFTPEALAALIDYDWPGNVRQLENVVQRALAVSDGPKITPAALAAEVRQAALISQAIRGQVETLSYREMLEASRERATRDYLVALMRDVGGNVTQAAERAGIERESMHRLLKRHGVRSDDFKPR